MRYGKFGLVVLFLVVNILLVGCNSDLKRENEDLKKQVVDMQIQIEAIDSAAHKIFVSAEDLQNKSLYQQAITEYNKVINFYPTTPDADEAKQRIAILAIKQEDTVKQKKEAQQESQAKNIVSRYDEMEGIRWYFAKGSEKAEQNSISDVYLNKKDEAVYITAYIGKQKDNVWMNCRCKIVAGSWLFTNKIIFLVDGKRIEWSFESTEAKTDVNGGHIKESVTFTVDNSKENDILTIAKGKVVKIRFSGTQRSYDYVLTNNPSC